MKNKRGKEKTCGEWEKKTKKKHVGESYTTFFTHLKTWTNSCFKKNQFFLLKIIFFVCFGLFWYADFKNNFLKNKKNIILIHFNIKNILKAIIIILSNMYTKD